MKKYRILITTLIFLTHTLTAIPGADDILPTESGQYVYYRDTTLRTESYIGFLQYDEGTYAIRYYTPNPEFGSKEVEILISIDPEKDYILMTGERIVTGTINDDINKLNYMHDLFYELSARRKNINDSDFSNTIHNTEDYPQYGGPVTLTYDFTIPIFNVRSITRPTTSQTTNPTTRLVSAQRENINKKNDKKIGETTLLIAITMGQLTDSNDQSFTNFTGIPDIPTIPHNNEKQPDHQIDEDWINAQENLWLLGNDALIYTYELEIDQTTFKNKTYTDLQYLSRKLSFAPTPDLLYLPAQSIYIKNDSLLLSNILYNTEKQLFIHTTNSITPTTTTDNIQLYTVTVLSAYYTYYYTNETYLKNKIDSITK